MDQELFKFRTIIGHQGPLAASDPDWKGSKYNVQVEWETWEITFVPLSIVATDDPVTCTAYAKEHDLLAVEVWDRFRNLTKKDKVLARAIKQSKIMQVRRSQTYMFGHLIPRNYMEAMQFDSENKNSKWYDVIKLEVESMLEYKVFKRWNKEILDKHKKVLNPPKGYHRINLHLVFAVKFDSRHKPRLVATMSRFRAAPRQGHMDRLKGSAPMPLGLGIMQFGLELINLITPSYQVKILTGCTLYMVMSMKSFLMTCQNHLARL